jgi:hypothetical protein
MMKGNSYERRYNIRIAEPRISGRTKAQGRAKIGKRRLESKSRPERDNAPLMAIVKGWFKKTTRLTKERAG